MEGGKRGASFQLYFHNLYILARVAALQSVTVRWLMGNDIVATLSVIIHLFILPLVGFWHEYAAFQSVGIRAADCQRL